MKYPNTWKRRNKKLGNKSIFAEDKPIARCFYCKRGLYEGEWVYEITICFDIDGGKVVGSREKTVCEKCIKDSCKIL